MILKLTVEVEKEYQNNFKNFQRKWANKEIEPANPAQVL